MPERFSVGNRGRADDAQSIESRVLHHGSLETAGLRTRYLVTLLITDLDVRKIPQRIVDRLGLEVLEHVVRYDRHRVRRVEQAAVSKGPEVHDARVVIGVGRRVVDASRASLCWSAGSWRRRSRTTRRPLLFLWRRGWLGSGGLAFLIDVRFCGLDRDWRERRRCLLRVGNVNKLGTQTRQQNAGRRHILHPCPPGIPIDYRSRNLSLYKLKYNGLGLYSGNDFCATVAIVLD